MMELTPRLLILWAIVGHSYTSQVITCTPPVVRRGDAAIVTCYFNQDINTSKQNVKILRWPKSSKDADGADTVLDCYWQNAADLSCQVGEGFKLVGKVGKKATVGLTCAGEKDEGNYTCEVMPPDSSNAAPCQFYLQERSDSSTIPGPIHHPEPIAGMSGGQIATMVPALIACIMVGAGLLFLLRKRFQKCLPNCVRCFTSKSSPSSKASSPEMIAMIESGSSETNNARIENDIIINIEQCINILMRIKEKRDCSDTIRPIDGTQGAVLEACGSTDSNEANDEYVNIKAEKSKRTFPDVSKTPGEIANEERARLGLTSEHWYRNKLAELQIKRKKLNENKESGGIGLALQQGYRRELVELNRKREEVDAILHAENAEMRLKNHIRACGDENTLGLFRKIRRRMKQQSLTNALSDLQEMRGRHERERGQEAETDRTRGLLVEEQRQRKERECE